MIGIIEGIKVGVEDGVITVMVQGVGYELHCSQMTLSDFSAQTQVRAYVYTHLREDVLLLFGFSSLVEKRIFLELNKVNGIGPKSALNILSARPVREICDLIEKGDAKGLSQLPKVGKKTAEQIILTLKGRLVDVDSPQNKEYTHHVELKQALMHLGFRLPEIEAVIPQLDPQLNLEKALRSALGILTN